MAGLLAKVKEFREQALTASLWSGAYNVPPLSITSAVWNARAFLEAAGGAGDRAGE